MEFVLDIKEKLGESWLAQIYQDKIRTLRTRAYRLDIPERENLVEIQLN